MLMGLILAACIAHQTIFQRYLKWKDEHRCVNGVRERMQINYYNENKRHVTDLYIKKQDTPISFTVSTFPWLIHSPSFICVTNWSISWDKVKYI